MGHEMTLAEWARRLPPLTSLNGVLLRPPAGAPPEHVAVAGMALRLTTPSSAWFVPAHAWPYGLVSVIEIPAVDLLAWTVVGAACGDMAIYDGDAVYVDGSRYGLSDQERATVEHVKHGDASPYPLRVRFDDGRPGQYKLSEIRGVVRARGGL